MDYYNLERRFVECNLWMTRKSRGVFWTNDNVSNKDREKCRWNLFFGLHSFWNQIRNTFTFTLALSLETHFLKETLVQVGFVCLMMFVWIEDRKESKYKTKSNHSNYFVWHLIHLFYLAVLSFHYFIPVFLFY